MRRISKRNRHCRPLVTVPSDRVATQRSDQASVVAAPRAASPAWAVGLRRSRHPEFPGRYSTRAWQHNRALWRAAGDASVSCGPRLNHIARLLQCSLAKDPPKTACRALRYPRKRDRARSDRNADESGGQRRATTGNNQDGTVGPNWSA
jgi:hypothetical protein